MSTRGIPVYVVLAFLASPIVAMAGYIACLIVPMVVREVVTAVVLSVVEG